MDELMLDPHYDGPPGIIPTDRKYEWSLSDQTVYGLSYTIPIDPNLFDRWPFIVNGIQVVPAHFIHTDREHRLQPGVDPFLDQSCKEQFIGEEGGRMPEVEDQWVTERDRLLVVGLITLQCFKEALIPIERGMEIDPYLFPLGRGVTAIKGWHSLRKGLSHINFYWILAERLTTRRILERVLN
jgi:hypothetical protein